MKNNVLGSHNGKPGTYKLSSTINGKPSWITESQAIWFIPQWNQWAIGPLDSLGTTFRGIRSDQFAKGPQNVVVWAYNVKNKGWWPANNDIIVECICTKLKVSGDTFADCTGTYHLSQEIAESTPDYPVYKLVQRGELLSTYDFF